MWEGRKKSKTSSQKGLERESIQTKKWKFWGKNKTKTSFKAGKRGWNEEETFIRKMGEWAGRKRGVFAREEEKRTRRRGGQDGEGGERKTDDKL